MIRAHPAALIALLTLGGVLALASIAINAGLISDDGVTLWASAITAADGQMTIGRILAAYPTIPFLVTALVEFISPLGTPAPILLAAGLVALLASVWLVSFRRAGLPLFAAITATVLLAFHPAILHAAIIGPSEMFLTLFLYLLSRALFNLRARNGAPEVMAVALALLGLSFSHPMGAALTCAAVPLLVFAVEPERVANSALNVVMVLVFPTIFCVAAFSYMSWVFPGSGWTFLIAPAQGLATWSAGVSQSFGRGVTGWLALDTSVSVIVAFALSAPLVPLAVAWVRHRRPLVLPAAVIVGMTVIATGISILTGVFGDPSSVTVVPPVLAAILISRVNVVRERLSIVLPLLVAGWFGGLFAVAIIDPQSAEEMRAALSGRGADPERVDAIGLGHATVSHDGILVDTFNAPAVVLGRGRAKGLLTPSDETFSLGVLFSRLDAPFVAVPDPQIGNGAQDRLNKAFPLLYRLGAPGYQLVYSNTSWRMYARNRTQAVLEESETVVSGIRPLRPWSH